FFQMSAALRHLLLVALLLVVHRWPRRQDDQVVPLDETEVLFPKRFVFSTAKRWVEDEFAVFIPKLGQLGSEFTKGCAVPDLVGQRLFPFAEARRVCESVTLHICPRLLCSHFYLPGTAETTTKARGGRVCIFVAKFNSTRICVSIRTPRPSVFLYLAPRYYGDGIFHKAILS